MKNLWKKIYGGLVVSFLLLTLPLSVWAEKVIILHTNDIHCGVEDNIGLAKVAQYKKDLLKETPYVALVDAGDAVQGAPVGKLSGGISVVKMMNAAGYDFLIPGNHEFDYGMEQFFKLAKKQKTGYYSANFVNLPTNKLVLPPYKMMTFGKKKIAFLGATTPSTFINSTPQFFQNEKGQFIYGFCEDKEGTKLYNQLQKYIDQARGEGADYVVLVAHLGSDGSIPVWSSEAVIKNTTGIDVLIDGHSHELYEREVFNKKGEKVLLAQTGTKMKSVGKVEINDNGQITATLIKELKDADPGVLKVIAKENKRFEKILNNPMGETLVDLTIDDPVTGERRIRNGETNLGDLVADAYRNVLKTDVAMINGGGIRVNLAKGTLTYNDLLAAFPFGNMCAVVDCTGQQILDALEMGAANYPEENGGFFQVSGLTYTIDSKIPSTVKMDDKGNFVSVAGARRVKDVMVNGQPLDPQGDYTVGGITYILKSGGNGMTMFRDAVLLSDGDISDVDAITEFIKTHLNGKVKEGYEKPEGQGRIKILQ